MTQYSVVLYDGVEPEYARIRAAIAAAIADAVGPATDIAPESSKALALPVTDDEGLLALGDADVAIVLDEESQARARAANVKRIVVLLPGFDVRWDGDLDVDLVLVLHEALTSRAVAQGAIRARVRAVGPIADSAWAAVADREALKVTLAEELRSPGDEGEPTPLPNLPWVIVCASALDLDDLAPALVQLSLVSRDAAWLFDVGADADAARALRRRVAGHGLRAFMFADGDLSSRLYQAADVVLGRLEGPEVNRALGVGASLVTPRPSETQLALAHAVETAGLVSIADAAATLAVTLDAALTPASLKRAREMARSLDGGGGAERVLAAVRELNTDRRLSQAPAGLPLGLERLSDPDDAIEGFPARPRERRSEDLDKQVDDELEALRERLGL